MIFNLHGKMNSEKKDFKNILKDRGTLVEGIIFLAGWIISCIDIIMNVMYKKDCQTYYNVPGQYFDDSLLFEDKIYFLTVFAVAFAQLTLLWHVGQKQKKRMPLVFIGIGNIVFMFMLGAGCLIEIINSEKYGDLRKVLKINWLLWGLFFICIYLGIYIASFLYSVNHESKAESRKKINFSGIVALISGSVYLVLISFGISAVLTKGIENRRWYETVEDNHVIITEYDGKFLMMDCEIINDNLYIFNDEYVFVEKTDVVLKLRRYKDVICKY